MSITQLCKPIQKKRVFRVVFTFLLLICSIDSFADSQLSGTLHVDNSFEVFISTDDSVEGTLISSGTNWPTAYTLATTLSAGQEYYLHVKALDAGGAAGFIGSFELTGTDHTFSNGLATLNTNTTDWIVSKTGWGDYVPASSFGVNGVSPWGNRPAIDSNAQWIWSSDNNADNFNYFSIKILVPITAPIADYRFDESEYNDINDEVIDSIGGFHGRAKSSQPVAGKICNAIDLSSSGINDYVILDESILSNKTDFSVSLWARTPKTGSQSILSGAAAGDNNELIMWFPSHTQFQPFLNDSSNGSLNIDAISSNTETWHHLVWTRSGSQSCLYRDKVLQGCVTQSTATLFIESLVLGQEQDSVGGGFNSGQAFDGLIDEVMVFDTAISETEIEQIYDNQDVGLAYDGSVRSCPISFTVPILDYRFDECDYTGLGGDVIDQTGNFNGSTNGLPSPINDSIVNKSLDLSESDINDWIDVPSSAVDGLDNFTVALWFKTGVNKSQQEIIQALGDDAGDDELEIHLKDDDTVVVKVRDAVQELDSNIILTNDIWHHLAITRVDENVCLFVDGVQQECANGVEAGILSVANANAIVIGQEQDSFGGGFSAAQSFEGQLDELKIYDVMLSNTEIDDIYQNELASNNYDGGLRDPVVCETFCEANEGLLDAVGIRIDGNGSNTQINNTSEALTIYNAWLAAGSPVTGLIDSGTYNVAASGTGTADRIDFGGSGRDFTGTLPYPGNDNGVNGSDFLVQVSGTISLPAGNYTIFVKSDDGFNFVMETLEGDTVSFTKFSGTGAGTDNELRFENPTGNSNTGGSFTLSEDSLFEISGIFFERGGGDFFEISIANEILTNSAPTGYEVLKDGALGGKVKFGDCLFTLPSPLLEYRFEENLWDGTANEIIDNTGNGYDAQVNNNSSPLTTSPAIAGNPGTCGYASQDDGSIQVTGLPLDTVTDGVKTTVTFWMNWDGTNNVMPLGWNFHDIWMINGFMGFNTFSSDVYGISSAGLANGWHHVAAEFTNGSVTDNRIHIDGVEQVLTQLQGSPNNSRAYVNSELRVGGVANSSTYDFHGLIDEFRVYESALSTAQIEAIMAETHACSNTPFVHHYEIIHDGQGLTCDSETVTIRACTDASCSSVTTEPVSLDFLANGAVISTETFSGITTVEFNNTDAETLTFSLANTSITAASPLVCNDSVGNSCDMVFSNAGFRFLYGPSNSLSIANQTSGLVFADVLKIQAVKDVDGVCAGLFIDNKNVDLSQENVDPGGTSGLSFSVNGNDIAKHSSVTSTLLSFGADSIATVPTPVYHDAGRIRLHANYDVGGVVLSGNSNAFWVSPNELVISAKSGATDLNGANATSATTYPAGDSFDFKVEAYNGASPSLITQNYSPGQIQIKLTRIGPTLADSVDGDLTYAVLSTLATSINPNFESITLSNFTMGVSTFSGAKYSEVGVLNVDVQDSNYANESIVISANAIDVGRFIPSYFTQTVVQDGVLQATCDTNIAFAAYSGQRDETNNSIGAISYLDSPVFEIIAYNSQDEITRNYFEDTQGSANDYMKLNASDIALTPPNLDQVALGVNSNKLPLTANINTGTLSQNDLTVLPNVVALNKGVLHYQLSDNDNFFYIRSANALVAPFTSDIDFTIASITDTDLVSVSSTEDASPTGVEIRFGRLLLENSFGPETSNLPQPLQLEHFDGTTFTFSSDNNCVGYDASKISLTNISLDPALTNVLGGIGNFLVGKTQAIELESPGAGNQGQIGVSYDAFDWLKYDWDNDGAYDDSPTAVATFGLYRADDRFFHWREVLN